MMVESKGGTVQEERPAKWLVDLVSTKALVKVRQDACKSKLRLSDFGSVCSVQTIKDTGTWRLVHVSRSGDAISITALEQVVVAVRVVSLCSSRLRGVTLSNAQAAYPGVAIQE